MDREKLARYMQICKFWAKEKGLKKNGQTGNRHENLQATL